MFEFLRKYPLVEGLYLLVAGLMLLLFSVGNYFLITIFVLFTGLLFLMKTPLIYALILGVLMVILLSAGVYINHTTDDDKSPKVYKQKIKSLDLLE